MTVNYFENKETIANNIILFMREKGYTRLSLSKLTGISRSEIDPLLNGESNNASIYNSYIMQINQTFELSEDYFVTTKIDSIPPDKSTQNGRSDEMMSKHIRNVDLYGKYVDDFEVSPFESIQILHIRSDLEQAFYELTNEERMKLLNYDIQLINNAQRMFKHIEEGYDFSMSDEAISQWWWHLDKVANGKIAFRLSPDIT